MTICYFFLQIQDGDIQDGDLLLLSCVHAPLCPRFCIRPLYWKASEIIVDSQLGSHIASIVLIVGGSQTFMNLLLYAIGTDGWHITELAL